MTDDDREAPSEENPDDGPVAEAEDDEGEVEAHGGWGGVGKPDS
jgi:hypothetical protein